MSSSDNGNGNKHKSGNGNGKLTKHHIIPKSRLKKRGGEIFLPRGRANRVFWAKSYHEIWHSVFFNLTIAEVHELIDSETPLANGYWDDLFGKLTPEEAHSYIEEIHIAGTIWREEDFAKLQTEIKVNGRSMLAN